eukprot:g2520.t1
MVSSSKSKNKNWKFSPLLNSNEEEILKQKKLSNAELRRSIADEWRAMFFSRVLFNWVAPLVRLGGKRPLTADDLGVLQSSYSAEERMDQFRKHLEKNNGNVVQATLGAYKYEMGMGAICKFVGDILVFATPFLLKVILRYAQRRSRNSPEEEDEWFGAPIAFFAAFALAITPALTGLLYHWFYHWVMLAGLYSRTALQGLVYRKLLTLSAGVLAAGVNSKNDKKSKKKKKEDEEKAKEGEEDEASSKSVLAGRLANLQSQDAGGVELALWMIHYLWACPIVVLFCLVFLWVELGPSMLAGVFVLIILIPTQKKIAEVTAKLTKAALKQSDSRVQVVTEAVRGIRVLKCFNLEEYFGNEIEKCRKRELKSVKKVALLGAVNSAVMEAGPLIVALCSFAIYSWTENERITAERAFVSLSLFSILKAPLMLVPMSLGMVIRGYISAKRVTAFFQLPDIEGYCDRSDSYSQIDSKNDHVIKVTDATFFFSSPIDLKAASETSLNSDKSKKNDDSAKRLTNASPSDIDVSHLFQLKNISLGIQKRTLTCIVGKVGSGKSALLSALLGELHLSSGTVKVSGKAAFVGQTPWIYNATVKENVLFNTKDGKEKLSKQVEEKYQDALRRCCLLDDLDALPAGDMTEIGDRGVNLSGGQRARIALARAFYSDAEIFLLDDVLSAVDVHVGRKLMKNCIRYLVEQGKTVILCTHALSYLHQAEQIVVMRSGCISFSGTHDECIRSNALDGVKADEIEEKKNDEDDGISMTNLERKNVKKNSNSIEKSDSESDKVSNNENTDGSKSLDGSLVKKEKRKKGAVAYRVLKAYCIAAGSFFSILVIISLLVTNFGLLATDYILALWSDDVNEERTVGFWLTLYAAATFGTLIAMLTFRFIGVIAGVVAATRLHERMLFRVLQAPLSYYHITSTGTILNRFSSDTGTIDSKMVGLICFFSFLSFRNRGITNSPFTFQANSLLSMMSTTVGIICVLVLQVSVLFWLAAAVIPLLFLYGYFAKIYRSCSRELKRLESLAKSPIFNAYEEALGTGGLATIRSMGAQGRLMLQCRSRIDDFSRRWLKNNLVNRWMGTRLDFIGSFLVGGVAIGSILFIWVGSSTGSTLDMDPGMIGFLLTATSAVARNLNWGVRRVSDTEANLVAVERVLEICEVDIEQDQKTLGGKKSEKKWQGKGEVKGHVKMDAIEMRYRDGLPLVLKGVNVDIPAGASVGIVGRTGSGKSSIVNVLLRLVNPCNGNVYIDGVNCKDVSLKELRHVVTTVPQEPVIFSGTIRNNIDPSNEYDDARIWQALDAVQLRDMIEKMASDGEKKFQQGLDASAEGLSAGEAQLLCFARALCRDPAILVLDEATSNVDRYTDAKIQSFLEDRSGLLKGTTIISIAHRIETVRNFDYIIVMDNGQVGEFGKPDELISKKGLFAELVKQSAHEK